MSQELSGSTAKRVLVDRYDRPQLRGYVQAQSYLQADGVELLNPEGNVLKIPYGHIKTVSFVRELEGSSVWGERREFLARPKTPGLWVELRFKDGDRLEGVMGNNLLLVEQTGLALAPPDPAGNTQKVFVPRAGLVGVSVLGVIGVKRKRAKAVQPAAEQITLFGEG